MKYERLEDVPEDRRDPFNCQLNWRCPMPSVDTTEWTTLQWINWIEEKGEWR